MGWRRVFVMCGYMEMIDFVWDLPHWGYVRIRIIGACKLVGKVGCELSENLPPHF